MNLDLKGKNVFVCGSSKGIGKVVVFELVELGVNVILVFCFVDKMVVIIKEMVWVKGQQYDFFVVDFIDIVDL